MKTRAALVIAALTAVLSVASALVAGPAAGGSTLTIVDTLGAATPSTQFSVFGSGGVTLYSLQQAGPKFTLSQATIITEIGGFVDNQTGTLPFTVQIRSSVNGVPDPSRVIATLVLSNDGDPLEVSYESVSPNLTLAAGSYFAMFVPQGSDAGVLLNTASDPFTYLAGLTPMGFLDPTTGASSASEQYGAVRILGQTTDASSELATLRAAVAGVGPGTSLADKVGQAQAYLANNNVVRTCATLNAFTNEVKAQTGKSITPTVAGDLIARVQHIQQLLGC